MAAPKGIHLGLEHLVGCSQSGDEHKGLAGALVFME